MVGCDLRSITFIVVNLSLLNQLDVSKRENYHVPCRIETNGTLGRIRYLIYLTCTKHVTK